MRQVTFSVVTPSRGDRPRGLAQAIDSVAAARERVVPALGPDCVEMLVGFDGVRGERVRDYPWLRWVDFPASGDFGNAIRHGLLKAARGLRVCFVDDDNALTPGALAAFARHPDADLVVGRIDTTRAFEIPFLPRPDEDGDLIRQGNVDPLCLCASLDLALVRGRGWRSEGGYESDYLNIRRWAHRAREVVRINDVVGVYDAGAGLDPEGVNPRQAGRE